MTTTKANLRQQFVEKRLALNTEDIRLKNDIIFSVMQSIFTKIRPNVIHTFLSNTTRNEVDTWKTIHWIWTHLLHTKTVAPYVVPGTQEMQHYLLDSHTQLHLNRWQIPEPDPLISAKVDLASVEVVLVPLLAFDKKGFRVGYGGGYYDRFLEQCDPDILKIGLSFFDPVDEIENLDQHDIPLNMCVTPEYIYQF